MTVQVAIGEWRAQSQRVRTRVHAGGGGGLRRVRS